MVLCGNESTGYICQDQPMIRSVIFMIKTIILVENWPVETIPTTDPSLVFNTPNITASNSITDLRLSAGNNQNTI